MPITPDACAMIVDELEATEWAIELRGLLPNLRRLIARRISLPGSPSGHFPAESRGRTSHARHQKGRTTMPKQKDDRKHRSHSMSPERFARKVGERVKVLATANAQAGHYVPYVTLKAQAEQEISTGRVSRYSFADALPPATPAGSSGNKPVPTRTGTVGSGYLSSNRGTDGKIPHGASAYGDQQLAKLNGRLQRLKAWAAEERVRLQFGPRTLAEIQHLETVEKEIVRIESEKQMEMLMQSGTESARLQNQTIIDYCTRNPGTSYDEAKRLLIPLR